jgi:hypothetical protein
MASAACASALDPIAYSGSMMIGRPSPRPVPLRRPLTDCWPGTAHVSDMPNPLMLQCSQPSKKHPTSGDEAGRQLAMPARGWKGAKNPAAGCRRCYVRSPSDWTAAPGRNPRNPELRPQLPHEAVRGNAPRMAPAKAEGQSHWSPRGGRTKDTPAGLAFTSMEDGSHGGLNVINYGAEQTSHARSAGPTLITLIPTLTAASPSPIAAV